MKSFRFKDRVQTKVEWLNTQLFAGQRKSLRKASKEPKLSQQIASVSIKHAQFLFVIVTSLILLGTFVFAVYYFANTTNLMEQNKLVVNLSKTGLKTRVAFGASPTCGEDAHPCWIERNFDDRTWKEVAVPQVDMRTLVEYEKAVAADSIFYRFHIPVDPLLVESGEAMAFSPVYINHERYEVFVNGRFIQSGQAVGSGTTVAVIAFLPSDVVNGFVDISIKGSASANERGINHRDSLYIGPRVALDTLYSVNERSLVSYFLLFLLTKGSIFIVFGLFFYFSIDRRALFSFLVYAFCVTSENFFVGSFLNAWLSFGERTAAFFMMRSISICAILFFFVDFFQASRGRKYAFRLATVMLTIDTVLIAANFYDPSIMPLSILFATTNTFMVATLVIGLLLGVFSIQFWRRAGMEPRKTRRFLATVWMTGTYLALVVWEYCFNTYVGFDKRAVFDLIFFYYIAFVTAREFGFNAGQVITLEGHMTEKRRMEAELQEAAEIAKAFMPGAPPKWNYCEVSAFHKSISESSGDWFTFEESPTGRFFHMIMCDITGHGVQAALVVSTCRTVLSTITTDKPDLKESAHFISDYAYALNRVLVTQGGGHHVSTLLGITIDQQDSKVWFISAGHPSPMLFTTNESGKRSVTPLLSRHSLLGINLSTDFVMQSCDLSPHDEILAYTDGLPLNTHLKVLRSQFLTGNEKVEAIPEKLYKEIWAAEKTRSEKDPDDDVSVVWFRRTS